MTFQLTISGRALGRKKPLFEDFSVPLPPDLRDDEGGAGGLTLRDLITRVVAAEVQAFRKRQEERRLVRVLSPAQIERGLEKGKVDPGGPDPARPDSAEGRPDVEEDDAVATALQAFEDGMYLVILDGVEHRELDAQVYLQPDSRLTFIRLTFLSGA
jgi:hypothetical protein